MGRELRQVPQGWEHPTDKKGNYKPLFGRSFSKELARWEEENAMWDKGFYRGFAELSQPEWVAKEGKQLTMTFEKWDGAKPKKEDYMPEWSEEEKTHIQLYENTTEGTPYSPVFAKDEFENLCAYAADHCSTFADYKATADEWAEMLKSNNVHHTSGNMTFI